MHRRPLIALPLCLTGLSARDIQAAGPPITVFAASSLTEVVQDVARSWSELGRGAVSPTFASSSALARQLEQGGQAGVFISADLRWMDWAIARRSRSPTYHQGHCHKQAGIGDANRQGGPGCRRPRAQPCCAARRARSSRGGRSGLRASWKSTRAKLLSISDCGPSLSHTLPGRKTCARPCFSCKGVKLRQGSFTQLTRSQVPACRSSVLSPRTVTRGSSTRPPSSNPATRLEHARCSPTLSGPEGSAIMLRHGFGKP